MATWLTDVRHRPGTGGPATSQPGAITVDFNNDASAVVGVYASCSGSFETVGRSLVQSFTGTDIVGANANGNQSSASSNLDVNFLLSGGTYDRIRMTSTGFAFESDNHAYTPVPLPAAAWLLLSGIAGLGIFGRRRTAA